MADQQKVKKKTKAKSKKKNKRFRGRRLFYTVFFTFVIGIVCGIIGYLLIILNGERLLEENGSKLVLGEASIIYDANGEEISRLSQGGENREIAEYSEIPEMLRQAVVATEDSRFYEHSGLDFFAIGRAVVKDVIARSAVEGASTITQQLAKNVFLTADKTFFRKATEASIAVALEQQMSKDQILTMYLNRIYFGKGVSGVKAAAEYYFDKDLSELDLWECATLAAIPKAPSHYNPINNPNDSKQRRGVVLQLMFEQGMITEAQKNEAAAVVYEPPASQESFHLSDYPAFVDFVVDEAMEVTGKTEEELSIGGYKIYTTLNQQAQKAVDAEMSDPDNFEKSKDDEIVQGAVVIMDHTNGEIKALSGGRDYVKKGWNRVVQPRQPGSAIKPIAVYGPALETGDYYPWTILKNDKKCFSDYCPSDHWGAVPVSMTQAIKDSRNLAAVWTLQQIGLKASEAFTEKMGIPLEPEDHSLALALGGLTKGATPLQMATAYSAMANGGRSVDPHTITSVLRSDGSSEFTYKAPDSKRLMSEDTAYYLTQMMQTVVEKGGTGVKAALDRPLAGKTGTTQAGIPGYHGDGIKDAWFVGYTPEWTAAVWMGYDKTDLDHILMKGSSQSAAMFGKIMSQAMKGIAKGSFGKPKDIKENKPPAKIENFTLNFIPESIKVELSWDPSPEKNITYEVYRKASGESEYSSFVDSLTNTGVDDLSIFPGESYDYYVVAYDAASKLASEKSNVVHVDVPDSEIVIPDIPMEPGGPSSTNDGNGNNGGNNGDGGNENGNGNAGNGNENGGNSGNNGEGGESTPPPATPETSGQPDGGDNGPSATPPPSSTGASTDNTGSTELPIGNGL
ncbi:PBP1A family penicillin-binding protein [Paenibacillus sp. HB172176]|uniref:transglycosylase domain-containing protein n=1 Tax=Paenibacillus sp. HB172176 TaxID=2493690 RepID=UPI00143B562A|nr:PBP1A family penicillin-binding protein [Paenibacillus sp. HB172176]